MVQVVDGGVMLGARTNSEIEERVAVLTCFVTADMLAGLAYRERVKEQPPRAFAVALDIVSLRKA